MFSALQQRMQTTSHLTDDAWYLDCVQNFIPSFETEFKKSREDVGESGIEMLDLQGIEDENERANVVHLSKRDVRNTMGTMGTPE